MSAGIKMPPLPALKYSLYTAPLTAPVFLSSCCMSGVMPGAAFFFFATCLVSSMPASSTASSSCSSSCFFGANSGVPDTYDMGSRAPPSPRLHCLQVDPKKGHLCSQVSVVFFFLLGYIKGKFGRWSQSHSQGEGGKPNSH